MKVYIGMDQAEFLIALHEVLGCTADIILTILFCKLKNLPNAARVTPINYVMFYN
jgi:hypothetical protein